MKYLYRIQEGESLSEIAERCNCTVYDILNDNALTVEQAVTGIIITINSRNGMRYVVAPYENIENIAKKYNISADSIRKYNNIEEVFLGEVIYLPS